MTSLARIGLGTAQFGLDYGVSNRAGRPSEKEIATILADAVEAGIGYLDTAPTYGDAETLIGRHLPAGHNFRIVSKLAPIAAATIAAYHGDWALHALERSLKSLRAGRLYGVLIHHADDLAKPGSQHIIDALMQAQACGWVDRIGVSVYDARQLALAESQFEPQLVQLPLNALDRRPIQTGMLARLKARGVEIHARSVFLQGLLLMDPLALPEFFRPIRSILADMQTRWMSAGFSPVAGCLRSVMNCAEIDAVIVGVNRFRELREIQAAMGANVDNRLACGSSAAIELDFVDPRRWPSSFYQS
jgi:aryl-alcohol dehydrogenase-like predicted oxidoreductase